MQNTNVANTEQSAVTNSNIALFDSQYLNAISAFAQIMAQGTSTVPKHLQNNQADCMAVAMQAAQWQMNPFAVAQKTHLIHGTLGYEAQLVNAVITRSGILASRFEYEWYGPWEKVVGKFTIHKNDDKKEYRQPGWSMADEVGIGIIVRARLKGEEQPRELDLLLAQARTRNSTLWADDPRQQLAYLAVKRWARLYCPDVILGVYTPDELEERQEKIINPVQSAQTVTMQNINSGSPQNTVTQEATANADSLADEFRTRIDSAETLEDASAVGSDINAAKTTLGTALFTELKNKASRRWHQVKHRGLVEEAINDLPRPGEPESVTAFEAAEKVLTTAKRHIGDELYDSYRTTLDDMKPEYITA
ncbi:TPA: recombinase RecT [Salmonella enterica]|nr:recombinase RecT [Salmonella enterica]